MRTQTFIETGGGPVQIDVADIRAVVGKGDTQTVIILCPPEGSRLVRRIVVDQPWGLVSKVLEDATSSA